MGRAGLRELLAAPVGARAPEPARRADRRARRAGARRRGGRGRGLARATSTGASTTPPPRCWAPTAGCSRAPARCGSRCAPRARGAGAAPGRGRRRSADEPGEQPVEHRLRVVAQAGVDGRGLDDRARPARSASRSARTARARATGPAAGSPARHAASVVQALLRSASASASGASAASRRAVEAARARRGSRGGGRRATTPALSASPRSRSGTTRSSAYWNGSRGVAGHPRPPARTRAAPPAAAQELDVGRLARAAVAQPRVGHRAGDRRSTRRASRRGARRASASSIEPACGSSTCSAIMREARGRGLARAERRRRAGGTAPRRGR